MNLSIGDLPSGLPNKVIIIIRPSKIIDCLSSAPAPNFHPPCRTILFFNTVKCTVCTAVEIFEGQVHRLNHNLVAMDLKIETDHKLPGFLLFST